MKGKRSLSLAVTAAVIFLHALCINNGPVNAEKDTGPTDSTIIFPKIDRYPSPGKTGPLKNPGHTFPEFDPESIFGIDATRHDLSAYDLRDRETDLLYTSFSSATTWPAPEKLPPGFDWKKIMELGKSPGFNIRSLHARGVTGKNVGIAIIDQVLLVSHAEYAGRVRVYEEFPRENWEAQMHGAAVASIAAGKTVGVAPGADIYFFAARIGVQKNGKNIRSYRNYAQAIDRTLEINAGLPAERKIRVISMSASFSGKDDGYDVFEAAVQKAMEQGIFVVSGNIDEHQPGCAFGMLGRHPLADPDDRSSYALPIFYENHLQANAADFLRWLEYSDFVYFPMDSRTVASQMGDNEYTFFRRGGESWISPYVAGLYALACQVRPGINPYLFWEKLKATGTDFMIGYNGKQYRIGCLPDPVRLIGDLETASSKLQ